jgi:hypothetical protein
MEIKTDVRTRVRKEHRVELTGKHLRDLLRASGLDIPTDAVVIVHVPGGGDWSNTDLEVSPGTPIVVRWVEEADEIELAS